MLLWQAHRGVFQEAGRLIVTEQQRLHFIAQRVVVPTLGVEKDVAGFGRLLERGVKHLVEPVPAVLFHRSVPESAGSPAADADCSSRLSQALAITQPRLTVAGDMPSTSAVSSIVDPPK